MSSTEYPKVLIISHNLYDDTNNIGKTLVSLFNGWPQNKIAQLYFRNDKPSFKYCKQYYCITDKDVLKSFMSLNIKKSGFVLKENIEMELSQNENSLYQIGNRRNPIISLVRDFMWSFGGWKSKNLKQWLLEVANPDVILFVPNDYTLAYRVALYVEHIIRKPMIPFYMDDAFYYGCKTNLIDSFRRRDLRHFAKLIHQNAKEIFTISEYMSNEYEQLFGLPCQDFVNSVHVGEMPRSRRKDGLILSYIGNLHSNRWKSIIDIGQSLDQINREENINAVLRIYSGSILENKVKEEFSQVESIEFYGAISSKEVRSKQLEADVLIHVEAFDRASVNSTRLSLSTKIPEYLSTNRVVFAYGPSSIASMRYLKEFRIAITCFEYSALHDSLKMVLNSSIANEISNRGFRKAMESHDIKKVSNDFQNMIRKY